MRNFQVPYDQKIEDKVFNGILTMKQFLILLTNFVVLYMMFFVFESHFQEVDGDKSLIGWVITIKIIFAVVYLIVSLVFCFMKKYDWRLDKFLLIKYKYSRRNKLYIYEKQFNDFSTLNSMR